MKASTTSDATKDAAHRGKRLTCRSRELSLSIDRPVPVQRTEPLRRLAEDRLRHFALFR